jgi:hypothetical protein
MGKTDAEEAPTPASPPASHRRGGPPHRSLPDAGVTYREHSAASRRGPTSCKPAKEIGEERAPSTPAIPSSGVYIILLDEYSSMSPIAKHTALRFVRHKPWLFRFGALRLLRSLVVILSVGYPSVVPSFLPFCLLFVVLVRSGCWCVA